MQGVLKKLSGYTWRPAVKFYLRKSHIYSIDSIRVVVQPGVFHPGLFFSTKQLYKFIQKRAHSTSPGQEWKGKRVLEMGCGTGLLGILCAKKGAKVVACDISEKAVASAIGNFQSNHTTAEVFHSDLFREIPAQQFDTILVNPPYFKQDPKNAEENAWYAGKNFEYFDGLFSQAVSYLRAEGEMLMVISDECDRAEIFSIASKYGWKNELLSEKKNFWETILIYRLIQ